jgi:hypothetical protein
MAWVGYKDHMTETCDDDTPHIITQGNRIMMPLIYVDERLEGASTIGAHRDS